MIGAALAHWGHGSFDLTGWGWVALLVVFTFLEGMVRK